MGGVAEVGSLGQGTQDRNNPVGYGSNCKTQNLESAATRYAEANALATSRGC